MQADEAVFLKAIYNAPRADAPRLIYADWLEEQGEILSEFIRWGTESDLIAIRDEFRFPVARVERPPTHWTPDVAAGVRYVQLRGQGQSKFSNSDWLDRITSQFIGRYLRPFPRIFEGPKRLTFYRGLAVVRLKQPETTDVEQLDAIANKIRPHMFVDNLILELDSLADCLSEVVAHPILKRCVGVSFAVTNTSVVVSKKFLRLFAASELPKKVSWLCFGWRGDRRGLNSGDVKMLRAIEARARELLSNELHLCSWWLSGSRPG